MKIRLNALNNMEKHAFVETIGWVFEHSPWIAETVYAARPFSSVKHLHDAMLEAVRSASPKERLALLRAHPDLAGKLSMSETSVKEQQGAGLTGLTEAEYAEFSSCNEAYVGKFGFPFIMAVRGHNKHSILAAMQARLKGTTEEEYEIAWREVSKIALFRLNDRIEEDTVSCSGKGNANMMIKPNETGRTMYYGKGDVLVYRTFAKPLQAVRRIPESGFIGSDNVIFALNVNIAVQGDAFLPSFTEGDNSLVVATDSMKNLILRHAADYDGCTVEGFLLHISRIFLSKYPQMTTIRIRADRIPFETLPVPGPQGDLIESGLVYRRSHNDHSSAALTVERSGEGIVVTGHQCGVSDLQLIKVKGSSFAGFVRDEYTTLPESHDRPLFIWLNIVWKYGKVEDVISPGEESYVASEQIRDIAHTVFHEQNSPSIQHLIYHIGLRILSRFPQLSEVRFESNNRTWETVVEEISGSEGRVYTEPRPPYGFQGFTMTQADLTEAHAGTAAGEQKGVTA
ncbi:urate oxidase [Paenibacillus sp. JMULE4]|uniref:factor-independent urate hydroxylase n=1 Tax=Paenibacillus TaxID=44249 RepID=UPI0015755D08|nr:urate oxidase [Paenibacillus sp. JMULE4]NTZ16766.1 urate oxidase [Paenibacillus sp. JMULE4]